MSEATLKIPRDKNFDSTLAMLREGYNFTPKRFNRNKSFIFQTRMMLISKAIFITGNEAAEMFYTNPNLMRKTALPRHVKKTLTGQGGVQSLDPPEHTARKEMFMSLMSDKSITSLLLEISCNLDIYKSQWQSAGEVIVFDEMREILCRSACAWAGIPVTDSEAKKIAKQVTYMFEGFGTIGLRHWKARFARRRAEKWARKIVSKVRSEEIHPDPKSALAMFSKQGLDENIVAVELLNLIRPIVAIATYVTYALHALNNSREWQEKLADDVNAEIFTQEVRRFYPFTPFLGMRVRNEFSWRGYNFSKGSLVLLDIYFMNHNPKLWNFPYKFDPTRFLNQVITAYNFIPQGGGSYHTNHRCAGEKITIEVMKLALKFFSKLQYHVPIQDLSINLNRVPTRVASGFIIREVK